MEDALAVYERPYDPKRPLVCVDEASKTLRDTPHGTLPIEAGQPPRQDYEYERNGTANIFMAVEPLIGKRKTFVTDQRAKQDFAELLRYSPYAVTIKQPLFDRNMWARSENLAKTATYLLRRVRNISYVTYLTMNILT
jgi:hypothetical protein